MKTALHYLLGTIALAILGTIAYAVYTVRQYVPIFGTVFLASAAVIVGFGALFGIIWGVLHLREKHIRGKAIHMQEYGAYVLHEGAYLPLMPASVHAAPYLAAPRARTKVTQIEEETPLPALPAPEPVLTLPERVRYEDVRYQVPQGHALLGVSESGVETCDFAQLMTCWIVGGSSMGKSNTVALKIDEAMRLGNNIRLLVIDPHAKKDDSLYNKIRGYERAFLRPVAQYEDDILAALQWFLAEFKHRLDSGDCSYDILLVVDEVSNVVESENEEIGKLLKRIARICGQESRGFGMFGWFISQKAAGLAWLRNVVMTVIAHKMNMMSERKLACNEDTAIARDMDTWPRGRVLVYGAGFDTVRVLQQPIFTIPQHAASVSRMPDIPLREDRRFHQAETPVNKDTEPMHIVESSVSDMPPQHESAEREKKVEAENSVLKETIKRMKKRGMTDRDISQLVGLTGRKYPQYKAIIADLGEVESIEVSA